MTNRTNTNKAGDLARATTELISALSNFRECQHSMLFPISNPSLAFPYRSMEKDAKSMELARERLKKAISVADDLSYSILINESNAVENKTI